MTSSRLDFILADRRFTTTRTFHHVTCKFWWDVCSKWKSYFCSWKLLSTWVPCSTVTFTFTSVTLLQSIFLLFLELKFEVYFYSLSVPRRGQGAMSPKPPTKVFVLQKKQILRQIGQLLRLCKCKKRHWSGVLLGALPPDSRYRLALRSHHVTLKVWPWLKRWRSTNNYRKFSKNYTNTKQRVELYRDSWAIFHCYPQQCFKIVYIMARFLRDSTYALRPT